MSATGFFDTKTEALKEQERLQKNYTTWLEYHSRRGWRVKYCAPAEYLEMLKQQGKLS